MPNILLDSDLIVGETTNRDQPFIDAGNPVSRFRWDGKKLIDCVGIIDWLIDNSGNKRLPSSAHSDVNNWQNLTCSWDDVLIRDDTIWRVETDADRTANALTDRIIAIKAECGRRIYATASQAAQTNIATAVGVISGKTASARSDNEKTILSGAGIALAWVTAMRGNVAVLATDPNLDFTDDANWPVTPPEVVALAAQF